MVDSAFAIIVCHGLYGIFLVICPVEGQGFIGWEKIMLTRKAGPAALLLSLIIAFHFVNNFIWLSLDTSPSGVDTLWHLLEALKFQIAYREILDGGGIFYDKWVQVYDLFRTWPTKLSWPPLVYLLSALINPDRFSLFNVRLYVNFIFLIILLLSTYFLGKGFFGRKTGLFAAFLVSFFPAIYAHSRQFELDFPLAGLTALCLALLANSKNYSKKMPTVFFGLCLGIATLVKLQVVFFLAAPMIYSFFLMLRSGEKRNAGAFAIFFASMFLSLMIFSTFWFNRIRAGLENFISAVFTLYPAFVGDRAPVLGLNAIPVFSLKGFAYYAAQLSNLVSPALFLVFLFALGKFIKSKESSRGFLLICLFSPYALLTFISAKWARYILPILPVFAVIMAWATVNIKRPDLRKIVILLMICYSMFLFFRVSWFASYVDFINIVNFSSVEPPYATKPQADHFLALLSKEGIVEKIRDKLDRGDMAIIEFTGMTHGFIFSLYLLFQDYVYSKMLDAKQVAATDLGGADYVFFDERKLLPDDDLLRRFRVIRVMEDGVYFLERRLRGARLI